MLDSISHTSDKFIKLSTSFDELHPPDNVLQDNKNSFWVTTGLFPQLLVISFAESSKIGRVRILSSCIKNIWVSGS
ncbi:heat shock protein beta-11 [Paragonimus westermani]|uniref:Heat shock protein beta-11 n=1 Tax=Paragonimus westermani TaxID=34504 RepID=A0A5J4NRQ7_9TREM|nr:heat shock protein beta-11 [Paragonimus westermani]